MDLNRVTLIGRIGADPKNITTKTGTPMCKLRVATSEVRKKDNTTTENTSWHDVLVFGKQATNCLSYLKKGREIWIEGKLEYRTRQVNGVDVRETSIVADTVGFLGKGSSLVSSQTSSIAEDTPDFLQNAEVVTSSVTGDSHSNASLEVLMEPGIQEE